MIHLAGNYGENKDHHKIVKYNFMILETLYEYKNVDVKYATEIKEDALTNLEKYYPQIKKDLDASFDKIKNYNMLINYNFSILKAREYDNYKLVNTINNLPYFFKKIKEDENVS
jgi:hypothetical protein